MSFLLQGENDYVAIWEPRRVFVPLWTHIFCFCLNEELTEKKFPLTFSWQGLALGSSSLIIESWTRLFMSRSWTEASSRIWTDFFGGVGGTRRKCLNSNQFWFEKKKQTLWHILPAAVGSDKYEGESKVLHYFSSTWGTIWQFRMLLPRPGNQRTTLNCKMPSSLDTLQVLLTEIASVSWNTATKSTVLGLPDFAQSSRLLQPKWNFLNHLFTVLWSTTSSLFAQQMFLFASAALWLSSNL